uniref:Ig-like domain-containing protein n=1 Tax=Salarias fasciatus TaxID=181472 RepID=A0A672F1D7_SALFA
LVLLTEILMKLMCVFVFVSSYLVETVTNKHVITRQPSWSQIFQGEEITLTCEVQGGEKTDWWYDWRRKTQYLQQKNEKILKFTASQSFNEDYECMATRKDDIYSSTTWSEAFTVSVLRAVLKIDPVWSTLFIGEVVTLTCDIEGAEAGWEYSFNKDQQQYSPGYQTTKYYRFNITSSNDGGEYDCVGRQKGSSETEKSETVHLVFPSTEKPRATLTSGTKTISVGGSVSLSCSVRDSDGWKYEFYRETSNTWETNVEDNKVKVSKGGIYRCRGERETSGYVSDMSDEVNIQITFTNKPVITRQPSWSQIFQGEEITLTCEVQGGEKTDWRYYWRRNSVPLQQKNEKVLKVTSINGEYDCMATRKDDIYSSTTLSEAFTVSVLRK